MMTPLPDDLVGYPMFTMDGSLVVDQIDPIRGVRISSRLSSHRNIPLMVPPIAQNSYNLEQLPRTSGSKRHFGNLVNPNMTSITMKNQNAIADLLTGR